MEITVKDLTEIIELNKQKSDLRFRKEVLGMQCEEELQAEQGKFDRIAAAGIELAVPNQNKLNSLADALSLCSVQEIKDAIKSRSGSAYELLSERAKILRSNHENRAEIAKLNVLVASLGVDEKLALCDAVKNGALETPLKISTIMAKDRKRLASFLTRSGVPCMLSENGGELLPGTNGHVEMPVSMGNRRVWVNETAQNKLEANLQTMKGVIAKVQLKNAERQVRAFSENEEKEFAALQQEYLTLLKEQDVLLKDFNEEEKLSVKR